MAYKSSLMAYLPGAQEEVADIACVCCLMRQLRRQHMGT
jgi:hypothetical protein